MSTLIELWRDRAPGWGGPALFDGEPEEVDARVAAFLAYQRRAYEQGRYLALAGFDWLALVALASACGWRPNDILLLSGGVESLELAAPHRVSREDADGLAVALAAALSAPARAPVSVARITSAAEQTNAPWNAVETKPNGQGLLLCERSDVERVRDFVAQGAFDIF